MYLVTRLETENAFFGGVKSEVVFIGYLREASGEKEKKKADPNAHFVSVNRPEDGQCGKVIGAIEYTLFLVAAGPQSLVTTNMEA